MKHPAFFAFLGLVPALLWGCAAGNDNRATSSTGTSSSSSSSSSSGAGGNSVEENIPEPDGPTKLTVVNGVNDYDAIRLCFVPWPDGGDSPAYPADAKGLAFAAPAVIDLASDVVPKGTDVFMHVIVGNLGKTAGKRCAEITSGMLDPDVLVAPLAVLPRSALEAPRSLLLVPNGCVGGPGHEHELAQSACGKEYSIDTPTLGLLAAGMSRIVEPDVVSLQAAHASVAMPEIDIWILPGAPEAMKVNIAPGLTVGAIGKMPPFRQLNKAALAPIAANILTIPQGFAQPNSKGFFNEALTRGSILESEVQDGVAFTLVGVGSAPSITAGPFWHPLTWTVVRSDPK